MSKQNSASLSTKVFISSIIFVSALAGSPAQGDAFAATPKQCTRMASQATQIIKKDFKLNQATISISAEDICEQLAATETLVTVQKAIRESLTSFINDGQDSESPLALVLDLAFDKAGTPWTTPVPAHVAAIANEMLLEMMNKPETKIVLLKLDDQPEHGESVLKNWIVKMKIGTLSDHLHWAVVDRAGEIKTYNYGFN